MKYLNLECDNVGLKCGFTSSVSHKKDNPLLELTLNFQIRFVLHVHEAVHILYKPLTLSVWMKQLPSYTIGCKTQIHLIFKNIFKAPILSYYLNVIVKVL